MKTLKDPRHKKRETIIKKIYEHTFRPDKPPSDLIKPIYQNIKKIDKIILVGAPEWPLAKFNKIDLAILRLAVYELKFEKKNPVKVIIDEAIELGKQYGSQNSAKFINGALGAILKKE